MRPALDGACPSPRRRATGAAINGTGLDLRRPRHAAVGRPTARPRASRSTTRRPARPTGSPRSARTRSTSPAPRPSSRRCSQIDRAEPRLPVRARRRRRRRDHVQRPGRGRAQGRLPAPVAARRSPDLHGRHQQRGATRPSRPTTSGLGCPTSRSTSSTAAASRAPRRCSTTSSPTPRRTLFGPWAAKNQFPTDVRIIQLDSTPGFAPQDPGASAARTRSPSTSPATPASGASATTSSATPRPTTCPTAWVQNASGALGAARTPRTSRPPSSRRPAAPRPEPGAVGRLHQRQPDAYPISAYSYIVTQCAASGDRPTCKGTYANPGVTETLTKWMRYIACDGQVQHGRHRLLAAAAEPVAGDRQLDRPHEGRRRGARAAHRRTTAPTRASGAPSPGPSSPTDPLAKVQSLAPGGGGGGRPPATVASANAATGRETAAAAGAVGAVKAVGGGSTDWRTPAPTAYDRATGSTSVLIPLVGAPGDPVPPRVRLRTAPNPARPEAPDEPHAEALAVVAAARGPCRRRGPSCRTGSSSSISSLGDRRCGRDHHHRPRRPTAPPRRRRTRARRRSRPRPPPGTSTPGGARAGQRHGADEGPAPRHPGRGHRGPLRRRARHGPREGQGRLQDLRRRRAAVPR